MCKRLNISLAALAVLILTSSGFSWAGGETRLAAAKQSPAQPIATPSGGEVSKRVAALEVAAELGVIDAQLEFARLYAAGEDVPQSHAKAFALYQRIVDDHVDVRPHHARASGVARAFVALGGYYRTGIAGGAVKIDKRRAASLMWHAASYLGDAEAQSNLALMYLAGEGVPHNGRLAVNWLTNAAKKRHARAQAILGDLLWRGAKDVRRQPFKGLALLSLARQNAGDEDEARWINDLYAVAFKGSQANERERAAKLTVRWQARMGRKGFIVSAAPEQAKSGPAPVAGFTNAGMDGRSALR